MGVGATSRIKSLVGAGDDHDFLCADCGRGFEANRQQCPECDGFDICRA
jgi:predicted amidophosphoribosyltransferase